MADDEHVAFIVKPQDPVAAGELARACGIAPATAQVLLQRGIANETEARAFLSPKLANLTPPDAMADRQIAADRLADAVRRRERVAVFGDYDVDGTTSAAILSGILEILGAEVVALVANRFDGGYGFSNGALARVRETGATLIVTCDCGSSDHERIARARADGIDVIVVDHHLVPAEPLPALAFLNPHRPECGFPYKGLCSAGLALSVGAAVRAQLGVTLDLRPWLDLVALGTIADVAPLDGDNRKLVRAGLALLGAPDPRPAVFALRETARIRPGASIGASDISFRLAPRLNAAGRLGDPGVSLDLLRARTLPEARGFAARIEQINDQRKAIERDVTTAAVAQVREIYGDNPTGGLVVAAEGWHRGVVGITASRVVERFGLPCIVIGIENGVGHGSGRTPDGFHLHDAVSLCREMLVAFGGHRAAIGLTVRAERVEALRAAFFDASKLQLPEVPAGVGLHSADVLIGSGNFDLPPAIDLARLEPVGEANADPLFAVADARVEHASVVAERHLKLIVRVGREILHAFGYDMGDRAAGLPQTVDALGHLRPDEWRGGQAVELRLVAV